MQIARRDRNDAGADQQKENPEERRDAADNKGSPAVRSAMIAPDS
jgi:hypothetical protein